MGSLCCSEDRRNVHRRHSLIGTRRSTLPPPSQEQSSLHDTPMRTPAAATMTPNEQRNRLTREKSSSSSGTGSGSRGTGGSNTPSQSTSVERLGVVDDGAPAPPLISPPPAQQQQQPVPDSNDGLEPSLSDTTRPPPANSADRAGTYRDNDVHLGTVFGHTETAAAVVVQLPHMAQGDDDLTSASNPPSGRRSTVIIGTGSSDPTSETQRVPSMGSTGSAGAVIREQQVQTHVLPAAVAAFTTSGSGSLGPAAAAAKFAGY